MLVITGSCAAGSLPGAHPGKISTWENRMKLKLLCIGVLGFSVGPMAWAQPATPAQPADPAGALAAIAETWIHKCGAPGATIAAIRADGELVQAAAGLSRIATDAPMKPEDRMFSGSIGKTYFAAVILQLASEGKLNLDDAISKAVKDEPWFSCL